MRISEERCAKQRLSPDLAYGRQIGTCRSGGQTSRVSPGPAKRVKPSVSQRVVVVIPVRAAWRPLPRPTRATPVGSSSIGFIQQQATLVIGWVGPALFSTLFAAFAWATGVFQWLWSLATWLFSGEWRGGGGEMR